MRVPAANDRRLSVLRFWLSVSLVWVCASYPAYATGIVTAQVENLSRTTQTDVSVTFGQVFKPGDVPADVALTARLQSNDAPLPLQVDSKATHRDGSLRHAVLTTLLPQLGGKETIAIARADSRAKGAPSVRLQDLLASPFAARVSLNLDGRRYTADARELLEGARDVRQWLSGPLVSEWIVGGPVTDANGKPHQHLAAYFHVRAYAGLERVRVDVVIENGWTFVPRVSSFTYDATIELGGDTVYKRAIKHFHHTRWHKSFWWSTSPNVYVEHDQEYLQATGAVPRYLDLEPSEAYLDSLRQESVPMGHGDLTRYFPDSGAQDQIGPLPRWTTVYVLSADRRAFNNMLANDDHAASYSVHYRDENTGLPVSIADYANLTIQSDDPNINGGIHRSHGGNLSTADTAHQPSIGFLSYLVTGDYFYLEELQFWSSWNHLEANPLPPYGHRQGAKGIFGIQVRGQAWSLRNLGQAAYATPDDHEYKRLLADSVRHNIEHNESLYSGNAGANRLGALRSYDGFEQFAPWMDDFYTWTISYLVDLGFDAVELRDWKAAFPVGRMGVADYCYIKAAAYRLKVGRDNDHWWPDFRTLYAQNFGLGDDCPLNTEMEGYADAPDGFPSNLRPALAAAVDANVEGARAAWDRFVTSAVQPDYADYPNWAVVPRAQDATTNGIDSEASRGRERARHATVQERREHKRSYSFSRRQQ